MNVLEPHPHIPVLATSGLADDIKIWVPTCVEDPQLSNLEQVTYGNDKNLFLPWFKIKQICQVKFPPKGG